MMINICLNSTIKGVTPTGLGIFIYAKGYKDFAPTELLKNLKDFFKDNISFTLIITGVESCKGHFKGQFVL